MKIVQCSRINKNAVPFTKYIFVAAGFVKDTAPKQASKFKFVMPVPGNISKETAMRVWGVKAVGQHFIAE